MLWLEVIVVLGAIYFGARLGSIGIGYAGGIGVLILTLGMGLKFSVLTRQAAVLAYTLKKEFL